MRTSLTQAAPSKYSFISTMVCLPDAVDFSRDKLTREGCTHLIETPMTREDGLSYIVIDGYKE